MAQPKATAGSQSAKASDVAKKPATDKKDSKRKGLIIAGVVAAVVVVLVVLACILIPKLGGANYEESYEVADELFDKLEDTYGSYKAVCYNALSNVDDDDVSIDAYQKKIDECKQSLAGARELVENLGKTSGVQKDAEVKVKFEAFEESAKPVLLDESRLDKSLATYVAVHKFLVKMGNYEADTSEVEIREMTQPLIDIDNAKIKEIGEGLRSRMIDLGKVYQKFVASGQKDRTLANEYLEKAEDLQDWMEEMDFEEEDVVDLTSDRVNDMLDKYEDLLKIITEKKNK